MEYTIEEIKLLYRSSPAKVFEKLKSGDRLYPDDGDLPESVRILSVCKITYQVTAREGAGGKINEIIIY